MHFRLRYAMDGIRVELGEGGILKFRLNQENCSAVHIVRLVDETNPSGTKLVCDGICERKVEPPVEESFRQFSADVPLVASCQALFGQILANLYPHMQKVVSVLRWRYCLMEGPLRPFHNGTESYSFDGVEWREIPRRAMSATLSFGHPQPKAAVSEQVIQEVIELVKKDVDEPLERQLFREAWNLREQYPKAAFVIGVAAAEIGFRSLIGPIGGRKAISRLLAQHWPGPRFKYTIQGREIKPSASILKVLKEGIQKRNAVIHEGAVAPGKDELREILSNIGQLLWIWDLYSGHKWALEHLGASDVVVT
jgi:hypothetical protein